jgi:hypothetical protein
MYINNESKQRKLMNKNVKDVLDMKYLGIRMDLKYESIWVVNLFNKQYYI